MTLQRRLENLERGCQFDNALVEVRGSRFFLNGSAKELSKAELEELAQAVKMIKLGGYLDDKGAEILEKIDAANFSACAGIYLCRHCRQAADREGAVKRYVGISPNDWDSEVV